MATQSVAKSPSSPAASGAAMGGILGATVGGEAGLVAAIVVGAIEGMLVVGLVNHFGRPAWAIVMSTLKAVMASLVGAGIGWWILTEVVRNIAANR